MSEQKYCVYCHTSPSGKKYVGISKNPKKRWSNGRGYQRNEHFWRAIQKYGWDNFTHEILCDGLTKEEACDLEIRFIRKFRSNEAYFGYNGSLGGENPANGRLYSAEERELRRQKMLGNKWCLGYKHGAETRKRMSEAQRNRPHPPLTERQRLICVTNLPPPQKGADNPMARPVFCIELQTLYSCGKEAAERLGLARSHISQVCRGKRVTTGGYHFKFWEGDA